MFNPIWWFAWSIRPFRFSLGILNASFLDKIALQHMHPCCNRRDCFNPSSHIHSRVLHGPACSPWTGPASMIFCGRAGWWPETCKPGPGLTFPRQWIGPGPAGSGRASNMTIVLRAGPGLDILFAGRAEPRPHTLICGPGPGPVCTTVAGPGRAWA